jgi:hypothetical protein
MLHMAKTMFWIFIPGAALGFTMMPWWWLVVAAASVVSGFLFWRGGPVRYDRRTKALMIACGSSGVAVAFYAAAVWTGKEGCSQPPADGFCMFGGLPFLSFCALYLLIGVIAWVTWARLRA